MNLLGAFAVALVLGMLMGLPCMVLTQTEQCAFAPTLLVFAGVLVLVLGVGLGEWLIRTPRPPDQDTPPRTRKD